MSPLDAEKIKVRTTVRIPKKKLVESAKGIVLKLVTRKPKKKKPSLYGSAGVYFLLK